MNPQNQIPAKLVSHVAPLCHSVRFSLINSVFILGVGCTFVLQSEAQIQMTAVSAGTNIKQTSAQEKQHLIDYRKRVTVLSKKRSSGEFEATYRQVAASPEGQQIDYEFLTRGLEHQGKYPEALKLRLANFQKNPEDADIYDGLCWHWLQQNRPFKAKNYCEQAVNFYNQHGEHADDIAANLNMGFYYLLVNDETTAVHWYRKTFNKIKFQDQNKFDESVINKFKLLTQIHPQVLLANEYQSWFLKHKQLLTEAEAAVNQTLSFVKNAKYAEAYGFCQKAIAMKTQLLGSDHVDTLTSMEHLGIIYNELGQPYKALAQYQEVLAKHQSKPGTDERDLIDIMNNMGHTYRKLAEYFKAVGLIEKALVISKTRLGADHMTTLVIMNNLGLTYSELGQHEKALPFAEAVLSIRKDKYGFDELGTALAMSNLALVYSKLGQYDKALTLSEKVLTLRETINGVDHPETLKSMSNLASSYVNVGLKDKAVAINEKVLTGLQTKLGLDHPDTLFSLSNLANTYSALGYYEKALILNEQAVNARQIKLGLNHPHTLDSMNHLAINYNSLGQHEKAFTLVSSWNKGVEQLRQMPGLLKEQRQSLFSSYLDDYQMWAAEYAGRNQSVEGFHLGDQTKGRSLIDALKAQAALRGLPQQQLENLQSLDARAQSQSKVIELLMNSSRVSSEGLLAEQKIIDGINAEYAALQTQLKEQYPKFARMSDLPPASTNLAPQLLNNSEIFISYLVRRTGQAQVFALSQSGKVQWVDLGILPNLGSTVAASRELISPSRADSAQGQLVLLKVGGYTWLLPAQAMPDGATVAASTVPAAQALLQQYWHDKLIKPVLPLAASFPRWIISPDKDLALLPFDTLLEAAPAVVSGAPSSGAVPLVQWRNLTVVQSFSVYALLKAREAEYAKLARPKALFAMGNAVYGEGWAQSRGMTRGAGQVQAWRSTDADLLQSLRSSSGAAGQGEPMKLAGEQTLLRKLVWQNLPGTGREVEAVSSVFAKTGVADTMVGAQASEAQLLALNASGKLRDYRYLLFSAHGYLAQNPSLSALVLSQVGNAAEHDGYITAEKWPLYDVRSDLTVLSACDTGAGKTQAGEGVMGLPYALFVAGNKNTLLSLWPVDDDATAEFMRLFFEKLHQGMPQPQALAETKRAFMRSALWSDPRYWAAFVLYGV